MGDEEVPTKGTVGGTQESEAVASKSMSKPKTKPRPQKEDIVSPKVEENEVKIEAKGDSEATQSDRDADEVIPVGSGDGQREEPVVIDSPTFEEIDQQVDDLLACEEDDEEEKEKGDVGSSASKRQYRKRSPFAPQRLKVPFDRMVRSCMDTLMGAANRATIRALRSVPLKHKFVVLCRSMDETSLLTGDVLYNAVRTDGRRCKKIDRLMEEIKADVDMVMQENQTLESTNEELKTALEVKKDKVKTLEDKVKELQTVLEKEKEEQTKKNDELLSSYSKYHDVLQKKMDLDTSLNKRKRESEKLQTALTQ
ncbi:hypothetical protein Dimus_008123, partial [Dionaea muscipula]